MTVSPATEAGILGPGPGIYLDPRIVVSVYTERVRRFTWVKMMYDTIIVPTDGSEHAIRAAEHGLSLARGFGATVHVVSAVDVRSAAGLFDAGGVDEEFVERLEAERETAIEAVEAVLREYERVETALVDGDPVSAILEYAAEQDADLIAMGIQGRTGLNRYFSGSVTERVVRLSDIPVLTVRANDRTQVDAEYDDILLPTDGSDAAASAIEHGLAVAGRFDARVHAVHVVDIRNVAASAEYTLPSEVIERFRSRGQTATERIATRAGNAGIDAVTAVPEGSPASELLVYGDENDVDLIAMGTTGRSGLERVLLGSTTERVIRRADMPVLAVNTSGGEE